MNPVPLGPLLDKVTKKLGLAPRLRRELAVYLWPRVVGPEVAAQTRAGPVRDRILLVRTANPALAHQLALMEREILHRYRKLLGGQCLRGIHLQIGQVDAEPVSGRKDPPGPASLTPARECQLAALAEAVPDPALAAAFLRAARAWARRRESAVPAERVQRYLGLVTGDTWPTAREIAEAWETVEPGMRETARAAALEALRRKILARLAESPRTPAAIMRLRGDLRRLALIAGCPPGKAAREVAAELLGSEAAAAWPGEE